MSAPTSNVSLEYTIVGSRPAKAKPAMRFLSA
jgi:hypothetical protein